MQQFKQKQQKNKRICRSCKKSFEASDEYFTSYGAICLMCVLRREWYECKHCKQTIKCTPEEATEYNKGWQSDGKNDRFLACPAIEQTNKPHAMVKL